MSKTKAHKRRMRNPDPTPLFAVGDRIKHPKFGIGVVKKIDTGMFPNFDFFYDVDFTGEGGDGTKAWLPKIRTEKSCEVVS